MTRCALLLAAVLCVGATPARRSSAVSVRCATTPTIIVSAYCPNACCCQRWASVPDEQRTFADGTKFDREARVCAVDPKCFPFGTVFQIPGMGDFTAHDTGRLIKGNHIDIMFPSHSAAVQFGRRVYPLEFVND